MKMYMLFVLFSSFAAQSTFAKSLNETVSGEACVTPRIWCRSDFAPQGKIPGAYCICVPFDGRPQEGVVACAGGVVPQPIERNFFSKIGILLYEGPYTGGAFAQVTCGEGENY